LFVEDTEDDVVLMLRELQRGGYEPIFRRVETAEGMRAALAEREWDIILSDYIMPEFNGLAALAVLKESGLDLPFVIVSGNIGEDMAVAAMKAGAHDYIIKGNLSRLVPAVERELGDVLVRRERRKAEDELTASRERLRSLSVYLQSVREEERTRIAREIHDELGQALTALKIDVSWLGKKYHDHPTLSEKVGTMTTLIDSTIRRVKRICTELRPSLLDHLGVTSAIRWQAEEIGKRTGLRCSLSFDPSEIVLEDNLATAIFRVFQEALTNIVRHAEATKVEVTLRKNKDMITLTVSDNGKGLRKDQLAKPKSFGLLGIQERARALGGEAMITGARRKGTTLTVRVPLSQSGKGP
jgi:signal transduction histidine kinase